MKQDFQKKIEMQFNFQKKIEKSLDKSSYVIENI